MYEFMNNEIGTFLSTCSLQTTDERRHFVYESRNLFDDLQAHNHTQQHHTAKKKWITKGNTQKGNSRS